ncbi:Bro-N domain-containing protein [Arsenophonus sp. aPb]|uniref:BRO-N domain-containing protein n=1 Tax=Arsenophonus sp. aPb TaxID=3041619 RepID=UPI00246952F2|nr:Bro-N domain-containing protein [Arsenophonus sp. aPb]WGL99150.1 Bro-N domain-containing protein [Arsenophonus sp. aPb]
MSKTLVFKDREVIPFDKGDDRIWFTSKQVAELLAYSRAKSVTNLYNANADEFTSAMTEVITTVTSNKSKRGRNLQTKVRLFSLRGLHLLGMLADTPVAKEIRRWVLNLIEKEEIDKTTLSSLDINKLKDLTLGEMQNRVVAADKWSSATFGRPGSKMMNVRKRHLKKLREAEKTIMALSQLTLPGFEDSTGGENPA